MSAPSDLPDPRTFLRNLISSIPPADPNDTSQNPLNALKGKNRNTLLTLHVLYPNEFLPALDLLDRGCVIRMTLRSQLGDEALRDDTATEGTSEIPNNPFEDSEDSRLLSEGNELSIFYVRSAQQSSYQSTSFRNIQTSLDASTASGSMNKSDYASTQHYEVRLTPWHCSCPAFAFSSCPSTAPLPTEPPEHEMDPVISAQDFWGDEDHGDLEDPEKEEESWGFGGLRLGRGAPPVCKHLLACLLVERTGLFARFVEERVLTSWEMAGWAAGWGA